jgi:hypothetical protein
MADATPLGTLVLFAGMAAILFWPTGRRPHADQSDRPVDRT